MHVLDRPSLATTSATQQARDRYRRSCSAEATAMTLAEQILAARRILKFVTEFRTNIETLTEGPAKKSTLARADATIAHAQLVLARLEHPSAPLSSTLPPPARAQ